MPKDWDIPALEHKARVTDSLIKFFARQIDEHGEAKACAIVKALSKRHLHLVESKSVEWEGLTLSRQPSEIEQICVKDVHSAQENGKAEVTKVLLDARKKLIKAALTELETMKPADYYALVLAPSKTAKKELKNKLIAIYERGRTLVADELAMQGAPMKGFVGLPTVIDSRVPPSVMLLTEYGQVKGAIIDRATYSGNGHGTKQDEDIDEELIDELTDTVLSRLSNTLQSRAIEIIASLTILGLVGSALIDALTSQLAELSDAPLEQIATGITNRVLSEGRSDEAEARKDEWEMVEYSAILDSLVCEQCEPEDGKTAKDESDLEDAPNPYCLGGDRCRCFHIFHFGGES